MRVANIVINLQTTAIKIKVKKDEKYSALKVGTNENGSACGRWPSIGNYFALW